MAIHNERLEWEKADLLIEQSQHILIIGHIRPDSDDVGSVTALGISLKLQGKDIQMSIDGEMPNFLNFLAGSDEVLPGVDQPKADLAIFVDCSAEDVIGQTGRRVLDAGIPTLVIDHHVTNSFFGHVHLVRSSAVSTTELILDWLQHRSAPISAQIADNLLAGIITDTQLFRVGPVSQATFEKVGQLLAYGANLPNLIRYTFDRALPIGHLRLLGKAYSRSQFDEGVLWTVIEREDFLEVGMTPSGTSGSIDTLLKSEGVIIAAEFAGNDDGKVKVALRASDGFEVGKIAAAMGGGGHPKAGGCTMQAMTPIEVAEKMLPLLKAEANKYN